MSSVLLSPLSLSEAIENYRHLLETFCRLRADHVQTLLARLELTGAGPHSSPDFSVGELFLLDYCIKQRHRNYFDASLDEAYYQRLSAHLPPGWLQIMINCRVG